jgi:DnaJ-class molecular chaperone
MDSDKLNIYEFFNLNKKASKDAIKKAYRDVSKKYHPDKNKSEEARKVFEKANKYYKILIDDNTREQYDNGYYNDNKEDISAETILVQIFLVVLGKCTLDDIKFVDMIGTMKRSINDEIRQIDGMNKKAKDEINMLNVVLERLEPKKSILTEAIESKIKSLEFAVKTNNESKQTFLEAINLLNYYKYTQDEEDPDDDFVLNFLKNSNDRLINKLRNDLEVERNKGGTEWQPK